eukprot:5212847-Prymnesium_polylepis.2
MVAVLSDPAGFFKVWEHTSSRRWRDLTLASVSPSACAVHHDAQFEFSEVHVMGRIMGTYQQHSSGRVGHLDPDCPWSWLIGRHSSSA